MGIEGEGPTESVDPAEEGGDVVKKRSCHLGQRSVTGHSLMLMDREELRKGMNQLGCVLDDEFDHVWIAKWRVMRELRLSASQDPASPSLFCGSRSEDVLPLSSTTSLDDSLNIIAQSRLA